jgi:UDP-N-acetylmuramoylalanine--D-glutamate ligase
MDVRGKHVLVVGLRRSGREAARCLADRGAVVTVTDSRPPWAFEAEIPLLMKQRIGLELGGHDPETFSVQDLIVVSPGVPWDMEQLQAARSRKIPVFTEVELASRFVEGKLVGITGSNGKTTTTALLGRMLQTSGLPTFVGGNIGVPLISAVGRTSRETFLVTELSSFQLEAIQTLRPHVAVLLNISPNHLDRHHSLEAYVRAKARIFSNQTPEDYAVLNADDPSVMKLVPEIRSRKVFFSRRRDLADGLLVANGDVRYRVRHLERTLLKTNEVPLPGAFNLENILAAATAACLLGADFEAIRHAVRDFDGVEHRLEFVREIRGVRFYNDSKATSVDAASKALTVFEGGVHLILGGKDKGSPYVPLRPLMKSRVREVLLIGAAAERIGKDLQGAVELVEAGDLAKAVPMAFERAQPGDSVLLAPACASFDQFQDFEHRGRVFKDLVNQLALRLGPAAEPERVLTPMGSSEVARSSGGSAPSSDLIHSASASGKRSENTKKVETLAREVSPTEGVASSLEAKRNDSPPGGLISAFEVGAEELAPMDYEPSSAAAGSQVLEPEELRPLETVEDEPMMFEVAMGRRTPGEHAKAEKVARENRDSTKDREGEGNGTT